MIAAQTYAGRRWVVGKPTKYCSGGCSAIDNAPHEAFAAELDHLVAEKSAPGCGP